MELEFRTALQELMRQESYALVNVLLEVKYTSNQQSYVTCLVENDGCEDGEVRLQDGVDSSNGRVEVCQYRTWGTVCTDGWDRDDAKVVCRQLGYDSEGHLWLSVLQYYTYN